MNKLVLLLIALCIALVSCGAEPTSQYAYRPPQDAGDGLVVGTLEEVNIDSAPIE